MFLNRLKILLVIFGVLLWIRGHELPIIFPDADGVAIITVYKVDYKTAKVAPVRIVSILYHGKELYSVNIDYVDAVTVGDWII